MDITQHVKTIKTDMEKDLMLPQSDSGFHKRSAILKMILNLTCIVMTRPGEDKHTWDIGVKYHPQIIV